MCLDGSLCNGSRDDLIDYTFHLSLFIFVRSDDTSYKTLYHMATLTELSNELIQAILDYVAAETVVLVDIDKRAFLSQESFKTPPEPIRDETLDVANFRLVCKRFSDLGISYQFGRVTTRFSINGFRRLEAIAEQPQITRHVRKFTYMVPRFYSGGRYIYRPELLYQSTG